MVCFVLVEQHAVFVDCLQGVDHRVDLRIITLWENVGLKASSVIGGAINACSRATEAVSGMIVCTIMARLWSKNVSFDATFSSFDLL